MLLTNQDYGDIKHNSSTGIVDPYSSELIYLIDDPPSSTTCEAACENCWYRTAMDHGASNAVDSDNASKRIDIAIRRSKLLEKQGWTVQIIVPDAFGRNGLYLSKGLLDNHKVYDQGVISDEAIAWTSGRPLLYENCNKLLELAWSRGLRVIALTMHDMNDEQKPRMRGSPNSTEVISAIRKIQKYNSNLDKAERFKISLTYMIDTQNYMQTGRFIASAALLNVDYIRLNRFLDFTKRQKNKHAIMTPRDNAHFFKEVKRLSKLGIEHIVDHHISSLEKISLSLAQSINHNLKILISTDFGSFGTENLELDYPINRCGGGVNLFGLYGDKLYPCGEIFHTPIGKIHEKEDSLQVTFDPEWIKWLGELHDKSHGCIGGAFFNRDHGLKDL